MPLTTYEEIVTNFASPTCVIAGPGAGKTHLLADRVTRLLRNYGESKDNITVLAYTTDARQHMEDELMNPNENWKFRLEELPRIRTMHSLSFEIVQEDSDKVGLSEIALEVQENTKVQQLMYRDAALGLDSTESEGSEGVESFKCKQLGDCKEKANETKCKICRKYREIMGKCNRIDFDDQVIFACKILEENPDLLKKYQLRAKHLLVDEYQDINPAQFRLISMLSENSRTGLFVVGDDAQSIYSFRGANTDFILNFEKYFPDAQIGRLKDSRRCHKKIMEDAFKILRIHHPQYNGIKNVEDLEFYVKPEYEDEPYVWYFPTEIAEAKRAANITKGALQAGKEVLILAAKKDLFPLILQELSRRGVPYDCDTSFLPERIEIVNRFLEWVQKQNDSFLTRLVIEDLINRGCVKVPGENKKRLKDPKSKDRRVNVEKAIAKLWDSVDRENSLYSIVGRLENGDETVLAIRDGLRKLINLSNEDEKKKSGEFMKHLSVVSGVWINPSSIIKDLGLVADLVHPVRLSLHKLVRLRTMKKAKGLQAHVVIIVGVEEDIVPSPMNDDIGEEARLFYVSMTRAKERLYLFHSFRRPTEVTYSQQITNRPRSRFLNDLGRDSEWKNWPREGKNQKEEEDAD